eukprot:m.9607 g.9607  ORF g.9607 m.9607 type:complete len:175 (-) comp2993_c0_seq1:675-1199(-)
MSDDALKTAAAAPKQSRPDTVEWEHLDLRKYYFFGPLASFATRAMLYPANLVKTRLQVQHHTSFYNGTFDAFGKIIRHEGPRALFKGFGINCLGIIASQCYITSYEALRHHMRVVSDIEPVRNFVAGAAASFISQVAALVWGILVAATSLSSSHALCDSTRRVLLSLSTSSRSV